MSLVVQTAKTYSALLPCDHLVAHKPGAPALCALPFRQRAQGNRGRLLLCCWKEGGSTSRKAR